MPTLSMIPDLPQSSLDRDTVAKIVRRFERETGLRFVAAGGPADSPLDTRWYCASDKVLHIDLIVDRQLGLRWITVDDPDQARLERLFSALVRAQPPLTVEDVASQRRPLPEKVLPVALALVSNGGSDPRTAEAVEGALGSPDLETRANGVIAASLAPSAQGYAALQRAWAAETDEGLRRMIAGALALAAPR